MSYILISLPFYLELNECMIVLSYETSVIQVFNGICFLVGTKSILVTVSVSLVSSKTLLGIALLFVV